MMAKGLTRPIVSYFAIDKSDGGFFLPNYCMKIKKLDNKFLLEPY